jgi:hypothetical protein
MAALPTLYKIASLPDSAGSNKDLKKALRSLFYLIGYCDTFHDFSKARSTEDSGKSIDPKLIKNRGEYVIKLIEHIDPGITWRPLFIEIDRVKSKIKGTFENAVYYGFTTLSESNPVFTYLKTLPGTDKIQEHLKSTCALQDVVVEHLNETSFQGPEKLKKIKSSVLIEMTAPAVVYSKVWRDNFVEFLHQLYKNYVVGDQLQFIEDAAAFPRNILTGPPAPHFNKFKKIKTVQTMWDPAGLSSYKESEQDAPGNRYKAPSFLALDAYDPDFDGDFPTDKYFNQATSELVLPNSTIKITKAGPSVNHLFMHILHHFQDDETAKLDAKTKIAIGNMIKKASIEKNSKNLTYKYVDKKEGAEQKKELRRLTASKRSGDYESIHSAIAHKAVTFTGDEPAFTYAVLNKQPAIYHICTPQGHFFRFYVPPSGSQADFELYKKFTNTLAESSEIEKFLGVSLSAVKGLFNNIGKYCSEADRLSIKGSRLAGDIFKILILKKIKEYESLILQIKAAYTTFNKALGDMDEKNKTKIISLLAPIDIPQNPTKAELQKAEAKREEYAGYIKARSEAIKGIAGPLDEIRDFVPKNFFRSQKTGILKPDFFVPTAQSYNATAIYEAPGAKEFVMFSPTTFMPQLKDIGNSISKIASTILILARTPIDGNSLGSRRALMNTLVGYLDDLDAPSDLRDLFSGQENITEINLTASLSTHFGKFREIKEAIDSMAGGVRSFQNLRNKTAKKRKSEFNPFKLEKSLLAALQEKEIPFGFSKEGYVAALVSRFILLESLHEAFPSKKQGLVLYDVVEDPIVEFTKDETNTEPLNNPRNEIVHYQSGGAITNLTAKENAIVPSMMDLYFNTIEPFIRDHFPYPKAGGNDPLGESFKDYLLRSLFSGSFITDMIYVLEQVKSMPDLEYFRHEGSAPIPREARTHYEQMISTAVVALDEIFKNLLAARENGVTIKIRSVFGHDVASVETIKSMRTIIKESEFSVSTICNQIRQLCLFLGVVIQKTERRKGLTENQQRRYEKQLRSDYDTQCIELNGISNADTTAYEAAVNKYFNDHEGSIRNTLKFAFLDWYDLQYSASEKGQAEAVAAAAELPEEDLPVEGVQAQELESVAEVTLDPSNKEAEVADKLAAEPVDEPHTPEVIIPIRDFTPDDQGAGNVYDPSEGMVEEVAEGAAGGARSRARRRRTPRRRTIKNRKSF